MELGLIGIVGSRRIVDFLTPAGSVSGAYGLVIANRAYVLLFDLQDPIAALEILLPHDEIRVVARLAVQHARDRGIAARRHGEEINAAAAFDLFVRLGVDRLFTNATVMPPGRLDRSPCGTGSAARLAVMHAKSQVAIGDEVIMRSTIGSQFRTRIVGATQIGGLTAILPNITGRAWIYSNGEYGVCAQDPFCEGFTMADTWGDGIEHTLPAL